MTEQHRIVAPPELPEPSGYAHAVVAAPGRVVYLGQTGAGETLAAVRRGSRGSRHGPACRRRRADDLVSLVFTTDMDGYRASCASWARSGAATSVVGIPQWH